MSEVKFQLHQALIRMADLRHVIRDTHGNLSVRDGDTMWVKPSGMAYHQITQNDLCGFDIPTGEPLPSNVRRPSVDSPHHLSIYRRHLHVFSICHTHSPYATGFAWAGRWLACVGTEQADRFGRDVRCLQYRGLDEWGDAVELLPGERAVLLGHHGVLTFADAPVEAVELAAAVEDAAQKLFVAETLTRYVNPLPEAEVARWHKRYNGGGYGQ